ncbi:MAG: pilus assembly protein [Actinomycetota bacterium]|nr:pilus assembly protein [Actinomycetota bacterium]
MRNDTGQATLELALCLPIVLLLAAALVQTGGIMSDQVRLWHAARDAARIAVVDPDAGDVADAAEDAGLHPLQVTVSPAPALRAAGNPLTVSLRYHPVAGVPLVGNLLDGFTLSASATMRIEVP